MIQSKTLESLNDFLNEDIQNCKDSIEYYKDKENLVSFYRGKIIGLEAAKELINQKWKTKKNKLKQALK